MTSDERFQRDVTLGKRIGLYKFRGELGTGNFSRVKLAFHQLAHGKIFSHHVISLLSVCFLLSCDGFHCHFGSVLFFFCLPDPFSLRGFSYVFGVLCGHFGSILLSPALLFDSSWEKARSITYTRYDL